MTAFALHKRELFATLLRREIRSRYKGSLLGVVWSLITPLVMMAAYTFIFSFVFQVSDIEHYPLYLLTGLSLWLFFAGGLQTGTSSLLANAALVKKVAFDRAIVPLSTMLSQVVTLGAMLVLLVPFALWLQPETRSTMILLPFVLAGLALMTAGMTLALAALNVYFRDVGHILGAILVPWFFLTPVLYSFSQLPAGVAANEAAITAIRYLNPVTPYVEGAHAVAFYGELPGLGISIYMVAAAVALPVLGLRLFRRLEGEMAVEL